MRKIYSILALTGLVLVSGLNMGQSQAPVQARMYYAATTPTGTITPGTVYWAPWNGDPNVAKTQSPTPTGSNTPTFTSTPTPTFTPTVTPTFTPVVVSNTAPSTGSQTPTPITTPKANIVQDLYVQMVTNQSAAQNTGGGIALGGTIILPFDGLAASGGIMGGILLEGDGSSNWGIIPPSSASTTLKVSIQIRTRGVATPFPIQ